jgi:hypothetical protein
MKKKKRQNGRKIKGRKRETTPKKCRQKKGNIQLKMSKWVKSIDVT